MLMLIIKFILFFSFLERGNYAPLFRGQIYVLFINSPNSKKINLQTNTERQYQITTHIKTFVSFLFYSLKLTIVNY